ncbi:glutamate-cysteine ligase modifier subunit [Brevipalpus obovatus]|uniref:glutamate-cysteine ligase modifier subunit n=1 Tax=Brevipalpus obovatus TaxID=246614 RepID=UPI003D9ED7E9
MDSLNTPAAMRQKIYVDTGNLLPCAAKKDGSYHPQDEALRGFKWRIGSWKKNRQDIDSQSGNHTGEKNQSNQDDLMMMENNNKFEGNDTSNQSILFIRPSDDETNKSPLLAVDNEKRENSRIMVKLFLYSEDQSAIEDAIDTILDRFNTSYIDTVILALPSPGKELCPDRIRRTWSQAEQALRYRVKDIGMSDLDTDQLIDLHSFATIKPTSNQVNLEMCCSIPEKMSEFSHERGIKILTHSDPIDFLPIDQFHELLRDCSINKVERWQRLWVARYTSIHDHKGIVMCKGYVLSAEQK